MFATTKIIFSQFMTISDRLKALLTEVNHDMAQIPFGHSPDTLYQPMRYLMNLKGKRFRPQLTLLATLLFDESHVEQSKKMAIASEGVSQLYVNARRHYG